jgi:branched-subunit amino acid ABC-type transport system permease component
VNQNDYPARNGRSLPVTYKLWASRAPAIVWLVLSLVATAVGLASFRGVVPIGQLTLNGLVAASYLALGAVGLTLIFGTLRIINFAHGDFLTLGTYLTFGFSALGLSFWLAAPLAVAATALISLLINLVVWEPMRRARTSTLQLFLVAIGLALIIRYSIQFVAGSQVRSVGQDVLSSITIGPWHLGTLQGIALLGGIVVNCIVGLGLTFSTFGKRIRALADNMALAEISGIDTRRAVRQLWIVAGGLAALAGILYGAAIGSVNPNFGFLILLSLFTAAVLGGIGNAYGALAGGVVIGLAQEWSTVFLNVRWKPVVSFAILILLLLILPRGIFSGLRNRA